MQDAHPNIKKFKDRSLYKYSGKLMHVEIINISLISFVMFKGTSKAPKLISFICNDPLIIKRMSESAPKSRHKLRFRITCKENNGRYWNSLWVTQAEDWPVGSDKAPMFQQSNLFEQRDLNA